MSTLDEELLEKWSSTTDAEAIDLAAQVADKCLMLIGEMSAVVITLEGGEQVPIDILLGQIGNNGLLKQGMEYYEGIYALLILRARAHPGGVEAWVAQLGDLMTPYARAIKTFDAVQMAAWACEERSKIQVTQRRLGVSEGGPAPAQDRPHSSSGDQPPASSVGPVS